MVRRQSESTQAELRIVAHHLAEHYPKSNAGLEFRLRPLLQDLIKDIQGTLWLLLAAIGLVLLISCINIASLFLTRAISRGRRNGDACRYRGKPQATHSAMHHGKRHFRVCRWLDRILAQREPAPVSCALARQFAAPGRFTSIGGCLFSASSSPFYAASFSGCRRRCASLLASWKRHCAPGGRALRQARVACTARL